MGAGSQIKPHLRVDGDTVLIPVLVQPRASKTRIVSLHDEMLKVAIAAPPVDGEANKVVVRFLARLLGVRKTDVAIRTGHKGRRKTVAVGGLSLEQVVERLP